MFSATVAAVSLTALVSGCGGGSSSTPITEDSFCEQKATKECQVTAKCGNVTTANCVIQRKAECLRIAGLSKTAPRVFHPENVAACVNKANSVYAKTTTSAATPTDLADLDDVCAYVFQGNSTTTCTVKYDCSGKKICDKNLCADKVVKSKGALCGNPGEVCAAGSYCAADTAGGGALTCLAKAAQSALCSATVPCVETLRCDPATNTCQPLFMAGMSCGNTSECVTAAPYCDPYVGCHCDLGLSFAGGAAACQDYGGGTGSTPSCNGSGAGNPDAGTGDAI